MTEQYLIAMDAGGSKTEAVLFTPDGTVIKHILASGINPFVDGFEQACSACVSILDQLSAIARQPVDNAYVGMPALQYFQGRIEAYLQKKTPIRHIRAEADGYMLISAMLGHTDGASLVCGTGSGIYIRSQGSQYGIGGWGYILDGCGSGFVLGRRALRAVVRQADGRGEKTLITQLVNEQYGDDITKHLPELYAGGRPFFASFARTVFQARKMGDMVAGRIFDDCVSDLAEMVQTAWQQSSIQHLVLNGGIFRHFPEYVDALKMHTPTQVNMIESDLPPLYGAAVEAMHDFGRTCDLEFKERFLHNLKN